MQAPAVSGSPWFLWASVPWMLFPGLSGSLLSLNGPFPGGLELLRNFKAELREGFHFSHVPS